MIDSTATVVYSGCTESGFALLRYIHNNLVPVSEIVTLTPEQGERYNVAGYYDHSSFAQLEDIAVYTPDTYSMDKQTDTEHFRELDADVLIVHGWQRLIPEEILTTFRQGAFGLHGSAFGLPKGRGRSPMNWSLIDDLNQFLLSIMHLDAGVDSGGVVATTKFDINAHDEIRSLYYKLVLAAQEMYAEHMHEIVSGDFQSEPQEGDPTYYPKRNPDDGAIDWADPTRVIYNLVRAVARPYPGAFTEWNDTRIEIFDVQPFSTDFAHDTEPGTVIKAFRPTDDFVVKTCDGSILVTDWEASGWTPQSGMKFRSIENESIDSPNRTDSQEHKHSLSGE